MRNLKITLAYDGTDFHGWQVQPGLETVQGLLSSAIERVTGEQVLPQGSGSTDAGVRAYEQVATCAIVSPIPEANLVIALNDVLPAAIRVSAAEEVPPDFCARASAKAKTYTYRVYRGDVCSPFLARYAYHYPYPLDEAAMKNAAEVVAGTHDFTSFAASDPEQGALPVSKVRTVFSSKWERRDEEFIYTVRGSGFLHHMVRNLVGTYLLVGKGTLSASDLQAILKGRDRSLAGPTAPPQGLYLVNVEY